MLPIDFPNLMTMSWTKAIAYLNEMELQAVLILEGVRGQKNYHLWRKIIVNRLAEIRFARQALGVPR